MQANYPAAAYVQSDPIPFLPFESTDATWVDTPEAVQDMLQDLRKATEIAVDVEHHDLHSYIGLVSLLQISTRERDWIVDTLVPWREDLQVLNEVFTDPQTIKVGHFVLTHMYLLMLLGRSCMAQIVISYGCSVISAFTSLVCLTRTTPPDYWVTLNTASRISSSAMSVLRRTRDIRWLIGACGQFNVLLQ